MFDLVARGTFRKIEQKSIILSDAKWKFLFVHCFLQYYIPSVCFAPNLDTMKNMSKIDKFLLESDMEKKTLLQENMYREVKPFIIAWRLLSAADVSACSMQLFHLET